MQTEIYLILFTTAVIIYYLTTKQKTEQVESVKQLDLQLLLQSNFKYVVIIRSKNKIYKSYEDDDLGKVGYHIYSKYGKILDSLDVYIKDKQRNNFMLMEKNKESESMIGVDHPEHGHIGYLKFVDVDKI